MFTRRGRGEKGKRKRVCRSPLPFVGSHVVVRACNWDTSDAHPHSSFASLPLFVPLCVCRWQCGCDCTLWRCWWLPLPSHLLLLLSPFSTFPSLRHQVCTWCKCVLGRRGCVCHTATPSALCQLQAGRCGFVLVAEGGRGVSHSHTPYVCLLLLPVCSMLYCAAGGRCCC